MPRYTALVILLRALAVRWENSDMDAKPLLILVLLVAVAGLGYLYYDSQKTGISIKAPGVNIDAK